MTIIKLSPRQKEIINVVKDNQPITSEQIGEKLKVTRATLRPDLAILTMSGILEARPKVGYFYSKSTDNEAVFEYIRNIKVKDVMVKPALVNEDTTVYDAIVQLFLNDCGTLYVVNDNNLIGAASRKDFLKIGLGGSDLHKIPVGIIMTRMPNIITIEKEDCAFLAAQKIMEHEIDSLPVIEKIKNSTGTITKVIGKISKTNITKLFVMLGSDR